MIWIENFFLRRFRQNYDLICKTNVLNPEQTQLQKFSFDEPIAVHTTNKLTENTVRMYVSILHTGKYQQALLYFIRQ